MKMHFLKTSLFRFWLVFCCLMAGVIIGIEIPHSSPERIRETKVSEYSKQEPIWAGYSLSRQEDDSISKQEDDSTFYKEISKNLPKGAQILQYSGTERDRIFGTGYIWIKFKVWGDTFMLSHSSYEEGDRMAITQIRH